mgnify:FL=1
MDSNKILENKILGSSAGLNVEIIELMSIQENNPNGYEILVKDRNSKERKIFIGRSGTNFVKRLLSGDKLLLVRQEENYLAIYGRLEEDKLYTF